MSQCGIYKKQSLRQSSWSAFEIDPCGKERRKRNCAEGEVELWCRLNGLGHREFWGRKWTIRIVSLWMERVGSFYPCLHPSLDVSLPQKGMTLVRWLPIADVFPERPEGWKLFHWHSHSSWAFLEEGFEHPFPRPPPQTSLPWKIPIIRTSHILTRTQETT